MVTPGNQTGLCQVLYVGDGETSPGTERLRVEQVSQEAREREQRENRAQGFPH